MPWRSAPDGKTVLTGSNDKTGTRLWDAATGPVPPVRS